MIARATSVLAAFLVLSGAGDAMADDAATEPARRAYVEGLRLRDAGDVDGSLRKLREAHELYPTAVTALEYGRALRVARRLIEARELLRSVHDMPRRPNESDKSEASRTEAERLATDVSGRIPSLEVVVTFPVDCDGCAASQVTIDGRPADGPVAVDPGRHTVQAVAGGIVRDSEVELAEGQKRRVVLRFPAVVRGAAQSDGGVGGWTYAGFGVAGAGLVVGTVTGIVTLVAAGRMDRCDDVNKVCPEDVHVERAQTFGWISTISFAVMGAGLVVGGVGLWSAKRSRSAGVHPVVGLGHAGLEGAF